MKQTVSVNALPIVELPSVRMAQVLNALHRVINPALRAIYSYRWEIVGCIALVAAFVASLYDVATDSGTARVVLYASAIVGTLASCVGVFSALEDEEKGGEL